MCWVNHSYVPFEVASHDIPVFKICRRINNRIFPYYQYDNNLEYIEGKTYAKDDELHIVDLFGRICIDEGFHSYEIGTRLLTEKSTLASILVSYSFNPSIYSLYSKRRSVIALCTIPKGSTYIVNSTGEYVSDKLKVEKFLRDDFDFNVKSIKRLNMEITSFGRNSVIQQFI